MSKNKNEVIEISKYNAQVNVLENLLATNQQMKKMQKRSNGVMTLKKCMNNRGHNFIV